MNTIELVTDIFKTYAKVDDTPLHAGEIMNLWTMLVATENFLNSENISYNSVEDKELKKKIKDLAENYHQKVIKEIRNILLNEEVELTTSPTQKPITPMQLPPGAKLTDEEVANFVVFNLVWSIKFCARGLTEAVRADVGTLFAKYIIEKTAFSVTFKSLMVDKGWIKLPPSWNTTNKKS